MCQNHTSPFGALADAYFAHDSMAVWHGSRGLSGKSMTLALLAHMESIFLDVDIAILGGSGQQSKNVHRYQDKFWQYETAPTDLLAAQPTATMTRFKSGQEVLVLLASQTSVRSPHPVRLRLDEVDEMDLSIFEAAMGQTMATPNSQVPAQTVASSTHQYPDGTFTEVLERATNRNWPVYSWCYLETSAPGEWLQPSEIERKRNEVSNEVWRIEYDLGEPTIGNRAIDSDAIDTMFDLMLGEYEGTPGEYVEVEPPDINGVYVTGADWARKQDYSVFTTIRVDCNPAQVVAFERVNRQQWSYMIGRFLYQLLRFNSYGNHDATGLGDVVAEDIRLQLAAMGAKRVNLQGELDRFKDTQMVGHARTTLLSDYTVSIERNEILAPRIQVMWKQHRYCSREDMYSSAAQNHLPDTVSSAALAWMVREPALASRGTLMALGMGGASKWRQ